jgi:divalent metal cation (Fe/Co/Zn/Cd) transporter
MKAYFATEKLFYALLSGQVLFAGILIAWKGIPQKLGRIPTDDYFTLIGITVIFSSIGVAYWINEQRKREGATRGNLTEKLEHYRNLVIIRSALVEGGNLMALVFAFFSGQGFFFLLFLAGLMAFLYFRPSKGEFTRDFNLSPEEERIFNEE